MLGQTASGKTPLAEALSDHLEAQLINADAFQVYRGLDVGTAKPEARERYELIDIRDPSEGFGLGEWVSLADDILARLYEKRRSAVVVGGSGLYVRALFEQYAEMAAAPDPIVRRSIEERERTEGLAALAAELSSRAPDVAARTDLNNPVRVRRALERLDCPDPIRRAKLPPFRQLKFVRDLSVGQITDRIADRVNLMVQNGWVREVQRLRERGYSKSDPGLRAIGYRAIWDHLEGMCSLEEAKARAILESGQYAKRQRTWLRKEPRLLRLEAASTADALAEALAHIGD